MSFLNRKPDALDRLLAMDPEEGAALLNQLFNPLRGKHVGARSEYRNEINKVADKAQNKV